MVNYGKGKVYKIWSPNGDKIYIGSTTKEYLSQRMDHHRSDYKLKKVYLTAFILFEEYGIENCKIELLEAKECTCKDELRQLEGKYIRELDCVNKYIAGRTQKEWYQEHPEKTKEYKKKYDETHKEEKKEYQKEHKEHIKVYIKEYQEEHKERLKEYRKQYYLKKKLEQKS
jgi:hypothetical protein